MKTLKKIPFSTAFALMSFGIGTILFLSYMLFPSDGILMLGLALVVVAIFFNFLVFLNLLYQLVTKGNKEDTIIRLLILISNIPIAYFYFIIVINKFNSLQPF
ncbi:MULTISPECIES: hypothetical protein [Flavobacterium]|uniref:hypothetical protein n=1 Tax=Flavobacterium TaxID=237 RepID=UPI0022245B86|nr:hypothetical protein [Flavobacterium sp. N1846]